MIHESRITLASGGVKKEGRASFSVANPLPIDLP
jgi:hypothetical protein